MMKDLETSMEILLVQEFMVLLMPTGKCNMMEIALLRGGLLDLLYLVRKD